jgi:hypothetical protein
MNGDEGLGQAMANSHHYETRKLLVAFHEDQAKLNKAILEQFKLIEERLEKLENTRENGG